VVDFLPESLLRRVSNLASAFLGGLVFDLWTCNCGRREAIFIKSEREENADYSARLIDNETCFNDGNWKLPESLVGCTYARRAVYRAARRIDSFEPFLSRVENLEAREIEGAARCVPVEWCAGRSKEMFNLADQLFQRRKQVRQATASAFRTLAH